MIDPQRRAPMSVMSTKPAMESAAAARTEHGNKHMSRCVSYEASFTHSIEIFTAEQVYSKLPVNNFKIK